MGGAVMFRLKGKPVVVDSKLGGAMRRYDRRALQAMTDLALHECGRTLLRYSQEGVTAYLDEAEEAASALLVAIRELKARDGSTAR